ncbi:MAG: SIS domain-containing protein [Patescibacteria group bacterium]
MRFSEHVKLTPRAVAETFASTQTFLALPKSLRRIFIIASGSSYSQGVYLAQLFFDYLPWQVVCENPYSFVRHSTFRSSDICIHISQEGRRNDNICPLKFAKDRGGHTIFMTSKPSSPAATYADEVYFFTPETEKVLVASASYVAGYALMLKYVNAQLVHRTMKSIPYSLSEIVESISANIIKKYSPADEYVVYLYAGYARSTALEGALKANECFLTDSEAYELKHYSHGKHFISWNRPRTFNVLYTDKDQDLVDKYRSTIFEPHHQVNLMKSGLPQEMAVFEWAASMLAFTVQSMAKKNIELGDIQIRDKIVKPHQFTY